MIYGNIVSLTGISSRKEFTDNVSKSSAFSEVRYLLVHTPLII